MPVNSMSIIKCDHDGCNEEFQTAAGKRNLRQVARESGWSFGGRGGVRAFCSQHSEEKTVRVHGGELRTVLNFLAQVEGEYTLPFDVQHTANSLRKVAGLPVKDLMQAAIADTSDDENE